MNLLAVKLLTALFNYIIIVAISLLIIWIFLLRKSSPDAVVFTQRIYDSHQKVCQFISGVLFAVCFIGLIPLVNEAFEVHWLHDSHLAHYLAQVSIVVSFLFVWIITILIEESIIWWSRRQVVEDESSRILQEKRQRRISKASSNTSVAVSDDALPTSHYDVAQHSSSTASAIILGFTLATHGILEGLGIGVMSTVGSVIIMGTISALHEFFLVVAMALKLIDARNIATRYLIAFLFLFSLCAPVGILIGAGLTNGALAQNPLLIGLLRSVATGGILYVVFYEMIPHCVLSGPNPKCLSVLLIMCGAACMTAIGYLHIYLSTSSDKGH